MFLRQLTHFDDEPGYACDVLKRRATTTTAIKPAANKNHRISPEPVLGVSLAAVAVLVSVPEAVTPDNGVTLTDVLPVDVLAGLTVLAGATGALGDFGVEDARLEAVPVVGAVEATTTGLDAAVAGAAVGGSVAVGAGG